MTLIKNIDDRYGWFEFNDENEVLVSLPYFINCYTLLYKRDFGTFNYISISLFSKHFSKLKMYYEDVRTLNRNFNEIVNVAKKILKHFSKYKDLTEDLVFYQVHENLYVNLLNFYFTVISISVNLEQTPSLVFTFKDGNHVELQFKSKKEIFAVKRKIREGLSLLKKILTGNIEEE